MFNENKLKKYIVLFIVICYKFSVVSAQMSDARWKLIWKDEFNSSKLDTTKWSILDRKRKSWKTKVYVDAPYISFKNGKLILTAYRTKGIDGLDSLVWGGIQTKGKFSKEFCKVEVRAKMECGQGVKSAIWMLSDKFKYTNMPDYLINAHYNGELDIMEHINYDSLVYQTIHTYYTYALKNDNPKRYAAFNCNVNRWVVYGVEIYEDKICFYTDGVKTLEYPRLLGEEAEQQYPFDQPYYLMIEQGLGSEKSWSGVVNPNDLPVRLFIDWVKFYEQK